MYLKDSLACDATCPVKTTAEIIEGKWTTLVVRELLAGKKRYSALQKSLPNISPKLLSARLRLLEQHGLVTRTVYPTVPPSTDYQLTELGFKLEPLLQQMASFGLALQQAAEQKGKDS